MSIKAIERVIQESSCSDPDTLARAVAELEALRKACRAVFIDSRTTGEEQDAIELLADIGREAAP